jgi:uncharacterized damage-inducible protein DinB
MFQLRSATVLALALAVSTPALAADAGSSPAPTGFQGDYVGLTGQVEKEAVTLLLAMPQAKMTWRPAKGVRSVSEVYLHIAGGIYFLMSKIGHEMPADVAAKMKAKTWESQTTNPAEIKTILTTAFAFLRKSTLDSSDADLEKRVNFFGTDMSQRQVFMAAQGHCWEHVGQAIAYARVNGVVPPWSKPDAKD